MSDESGVGVIEMPKFDVIDKISQKDKQVFDTWAADNTKDVANIPKDVFRFLIPPELLRHAEDPEKVDIRIAKNDKDEFVFFIVEEKEDPLTDMNALQSNYYSVDNDMVDEFHALYPQAIAADILSPNDYVFLTTEIERISPEHLYVADYFDRAAMRGQGITTAYYNRLNTFAQALGYHYITGNNARSNIGFFKNILRRQALDEMPITEQTQLREDLNAKGIQNTQYVTVQTLNHDTTHS